MTRRGPGVSYYAIRSGDKLRGILREVVTAHTRSLDLWTENGWIYSPWSIGSISGHGDDDAEPMGEPTPDELRAVIESRRAAAAENRRLAGFSALGAENQRALEADTAAAHTAKTSEVPAGPAPGDAGVPPPPVRRMSRDFELLDKFNRGELLTPDEQAEMAKLSAAQRARFEADPEFRVLVRNPPTTLSTGEQSRLLMDVCLGRPPSIPGDEAERFYRKVAQEVEWLAAQGFAIDIPNELPD